MPSVAGGCLAHKLPKSACDRSLWIATLDMVHRLTIVPCTEISDQDACNELLFSLTISYGVSHTAIHKCSRIPLYDMSSSVCLTLEPDRHGALVVLNVMQPRSSPIFPRMGYLCESHTRMFA